MTEDEARQVLLLQAVETAPAAPPQPGRSPGWLWSAEDARWATQQAAATVGEDAGAQRFVVARAALALQRLLPRDAAAQRWLARRGWHPAWLLLALLLGGVAGVLADQLGPPQRVNLLAPAVWAVVAWNLAVYLVMLLPLPSAGPAGLRGWLAGLGLRGPGGNGATAAAGALWARHAAGLMAHRAALVLHGAAAALALGLVAGLYLRGLVLDYRAGWQSTFLDAATVQQALGWLLAPAAWFTGVAVPEVAPLRLAPGTDATASAAPWIHLYATTLVLAVVLPRGLLALWAARRAAALSQRFPLALDTPYFEALHPLMRPGRPRVLRLLWVPAAGQPPAALFDTPLAPWPADGGPLTLLRSEQDDELQLLPAPATLAAVPEPPPPWWAWKWPPWRRSPADPLPALREQVAAALLLTAPGAPRPPWLARLERPVVVLLDGEAAAEADTAEAGIPLHQRADGWLPEGRLLQALGAALEDDARLHRLADAWKARQAARFDALVAELAHTLAELACTHEAVAEDAGLFARRGEAAAAEAAREQLVQALEAAALAHGERLQALLHPPPNALATPQTGPGAAVPAQVGDGAAVRAPASEGGTLRAQTGEGSALRAQVSEGFTLRTRVGEGRAALMGGVLSGALAGLKADVLSGGLTMGAGAVAGAVVGGLASAGAARGLNLVRGTDRSFVAWDEAALTRITETLLQRTLVAGYGLAPDAAAAALAPALAARQPALATLWRARQRQFHNPGEAQALAQTLQSPLADTLVQALGGPGRA
jgi:hypothetical protein